MKCISNIVEKNKIKSSFEDFAHKVMHPLDSTSSDLTTANLFTLTAADFLTTRRPASTIESSSSPVPIPSFSSQPPTPPANVASQSPDTSRWSLSPRIGVSSLLKLSGAAMEHLERTVSGSPPKGRARSSTNDERMLSSQSR